MQCKNIVVLGSTGTIGINTLKVVDRNPGMFKIVGLTANKNTKLLEKQILKYSPSYVAVGEKGIALLKRRFSSRKIKILDLNDGLEEIVAFTEVNIVVIGMSGSVALKPFLSAIKAGKIIATANKEALVIAGNIIMREAKKHKAQILPIDSEQSAIFQCLDGNRKEDLKKVLLTASGGALLNTPKKDFSNLSVEKILAHPRWKMGKKITVDSATMMNKGFEIIEAIRLFDLKVSEIDVIVHPEAIIHSMVEFKDGSIIAQLGITDMRLPIQYALTYPKRIASGLKNTNFFDLKQLTFKKPDYNRFPSLSLAIHAAKVDGTVPSVLNAADEEVVAAFLAGKISFTKIYKIIEKIVLKHRNKKTATLKDILEADQWAREEARKVITNGRI